MKNIIYQYWDGPLSVGCKAGVEAMKSYAAYIGAEYRFEHNPQYFAKELGQHQSKYFGAFRPIYDEDFHQYDNVLFADTDIFPVKGLTKNIFEEFTSDIGICEEEMQPQLRLQTAGQITSARDEQWAKAIKKHWNVDVPRTNDGLVRAYNSGVVLYSNKGLKEAKEKFIPFKQYVNTMNKEKLITFYTLDQPYLHAMLCVTGINWQTMDSGWNSYVHYFKQNVNGAVVKQINDTRNENTKFVHIQLAGADNYDKEKLDRITNLPQEEWNL